MCPPFRPLWPVSLIALAWLAAGSAVAASRYDPALRFLTMTTRHFVIHFHRGEEPLASRLAIIAEAAHSDLALRLRVTVSGRTHVVLADQDDVANGFATTFPYNAIHIVAGPPGTSSLIGNTDDWLRLVFVHEYTHILHLDQAASIARAFRFVFGRAPIGFPNGTQPRWQIEGLATFEETQVTGRGRMVAGDFQALVATPRRAGLLEPLDRTNGGLVPWPGGNAPYAYGGFFFRYLESRFGEESIARLARTTARGYYYMPGFAFRRTFHTPLGEVWRDFERSFSLPAGNREPVEQEPQRLTFTGFQVTRPRFAPTGISIATRRGSIPPPAVLYSVQDADDFPSLMAVAADGQGRPQQVVDRYGGEGLGIDKHGVIFDQVEVNRSIALKSDLYRLDLATRHVTRLTRGGRLMAPDVSPDGSRLACIRLADGVRMMVVFDLAALERAGLDQMPRPVFVLDEPDVEYGSPRWSPNGQWIAVERWRLGGSSELAIVNVTTRRVVALTSARAGRHTSPAWFPDAKTIVYSSDHEGGDFALYAAEISFSSADIARLSASYRVASVAGGAMAPDVSPDGRTIAFVGSTPSGNDVFTLPVDRGKWTRLALDAASEVPRPVATAAAQEARATSAPTASDYTPLGMLLPRYWMPALRWEDGFLKVGATTSSEDVLGRHLTGVTAVWRVTGGSAGRPLSGRPEWSASYVYDRWRPSFFVSGAERVSFVNTASQTGQPVDAALRELTAEAGVSFPMMTVRHAQLWQAGVAADLTRFENPSAHNVRRRNAVRLAWAYNSAKTYGFSISSEDGFAVSVTAELPRRGLGGDGDAASFTGEVRAYPRLGGRHAVLALRAGAGTSSGDLGVRRVFYLGGSDPAGSLIDFGSSGLSMLRGFSPLTFAGFHICVANIDYRRPIVRLDRGVSWLPLMARVIHASVFADAGNAWMQGFQLNETKTSVGGEASLDFVIGYTLPMTLSVGAAWTKSGGSAPFSGPNFYFRIGRAF